LHGKALRRPLFIAPMPGQSLRYGHAPGHIALPHNLLQPNTVLLI